MKRLVAALAFLVLLASLLGLLLQAGCDSPAGTEPRTRQRIVTTTPMLGDMVRSVVGDSADVTALMGEGVDPHLYKPTRTDVEAISGADVVVTNGLYLEGRMQDTFQRAKEAGRTVIAVGETLSPDELIHPRGAAAHPDPQRVDGSPALGQVRRGAGARACEARSGACGSLSRERRALCR
jgi:manganese/zinc/iron transport system substrate-binding protein